jgi:hypothetical protein
LDSGYPRACRFRKYQNLNRSLGLVLPTFFKTRFKFIKCGQNRPNLDKIGQNWPIFENFRQFFRSWNTPETVLNEYNKKWDFFKKIERFHFWSIFANFSHILWTKNHVLKKSSKNVPMTAQHELLNCVVHLLSVPSLEDASTSWPSSSGIRGHRWTYLTILESADYALFKMVRYVLLRPLRPELDGQDVEASSREDTYLSLRPYFSTPTVITFGVSFELLLFLTSNVKFFEC